MLKKLLLTSITIAALFLNSHNKVSAVQFNFYAFGDIGATTASAKSLQYVNANISDFTLAVGDLSYNDVTPESAWCNWVKSYVGANYPFEVLAGNHEEQGGPNGYIMNFAACLPDKLSSVGKYAANYYFDYPKTNPIARFILVSPASKVDNISYTYTKGNSYYNELAGYIDDARAKNIQWIIVGMHKNCITVGSKPCEVGEDIINLLAEKKVDLIVQGHDHTYQRTKQLLSIKKNTFDPSYIVSGNPTESQYIKGKGPILVINGNPGGASLYDVNSTDTEAGYFAKALGNNQGIDFVTNSTGLQTGRGIVKYTLSDTQLTGTYVMTTVTKSGNNFSDTFTITKASTCTTRVVNSFCLDVMDYNGNGTIEIADVILLLKYFFDNSIILSSKSTPDINKDGVVNLIDIVQFLQYYFS